MGYLKRGLIFLGALLPLILLSIEASSQEGEVRMANAQSIYQDILATLNEDGSLHFPTQTPKRVSPPAPKQIVKSVQSETKEFVDEIRFEIQESVEFPSSLKGKGYRAKVLVEFGLNWDGTLRDLSAKGEQGPALGIFESRALNAVRKAARFFPDVPARVDIKSLKIKIPIIFEEV